MKFRRIKPKYHAKNPDVKTKSSPAYGKLMKDDGYFSTIDPLRRIKVAESTHDLGEYLLIR
ncbi:MAG: hypothetical protein V2B19_08495 [Pseudomonadota bacterium]